MSLFFDKAFKKSNKKKIYPKAMEIKKEKINTPDEKSTPLTTPLIIPKAEYKVTKEDIKEIVTQSDKETSAETLTKIQEFLDKDLTKTEEILHRENVKVYRNVQAVVVEEAKRVSLGVKEESEGIKKKLKAGTVFAILAFSFAVLDLIFNILTWLEIL